MDSLRMICAGGCGQPAEVGEGLCRSCHASLIGKLAWEAKPENTGAEMPKNNLRARFFVSPDGTVIEKVKKYIPTALVREVYKRFNSTCAFCGDKVRRGGLYDSPFRDEDKAGSVDHILPVSRGGSHEISNLRLLCRTCNCSRGAGLASTVECEG